MRQTSVVLVVCIIFVIFLPKNYNETLIFEFVQIYAEITVGPIFYGHSVQILTTDIVDTSFYGPPGKLVSQLSLYHFAPH